MLLETLSNTKSPNHLAELGWTTRDALNSTFFSKKEGKTSHEAAGSSTVLLTESAARIAATVGRSTVSMALQIAAAI